MVAHLIFNNGRCYCAVIGHSDSESDEEFAKKVLQQTKETYERKLAQQFGAHTEEFKYHISACYWHIHTVPVEEAPHEKGSSEREKYGDNGDPGRDKAE